MLIPILVKIDKEMRPWECSQTDTLAHWQTQTDFTICPVASARVCESLEHATSGAGSKL